MKIDFSSLPAAIRAKYEQKYGVEAAKQKAKPAIVKAEPVQEPEPVDDDYVAKTGEPKCSRCDKRSKYAVLGFTKEGVRCLRYCMKHYFLDKVGKLPSKEGDDEDTSDR